jgi:hypothetical protein
MLNVATESLDLFKDKLFVEKTFEFPLACFADKLAARELFPVVDFEVVADEMRMFAIIDNV